MAPPPTKAPAKPAAAPTDKPTASAPVKKPTVVATTRPIAGNTPAQNKANTIAATKPVG